MKILTQISGRDCEECKGTGINKPIVDRIFCRACKGFAGKSPTTLYYNAEDFECDTPSAETDRGFVHGVDCKCKGTGLILPKKNEVINCCEHKIIKTQHKGWMHIDEEDEVSRLCFDCSCETPYKFHLTSDAEVKTITEWFSEQNKGIERLRIGQLMADHNLKESDKLVLVRGYYE